MRLFNQWWCVCIHDLEFARNAERSNKTSNSCPHFGRIKKLKSRANKELWQLVTQISGPPVIVRNTRSLSRLKMLRVVLRKYEIVVACYHRLWNRKFVIMQLTR